METKNKFKKNHLVKILHRPIFAQLKMYDVSLMVLGFGFWGRCKNLTWQFNINVN